MTLTPPRVTPTAGRRLARNTGVLVGAELLIKVFNLGFYALLSREMFSRGLGEWTYGLGLVTLYATLFNGGLGTLYTREAATSPERAGALLGRFVPLRLLLVAVALLGLAPLVWLQRGMGSPAFLYVLGVAPLASLIGESFRSVFRARQQLHFDAMLNLAERGISSGLALWAVLATHSLVWVASAWSAGSVVVALIAAVWIWRERIIGPLVWDFREMAGLMRRALPLFLLAVLGQLYFRQDVVILRALTSPETVGYYGAAYRLFEMFVFLPGSLTLAYLPAASLVRVTAPETFRGLVQQTLTLCFALSLPLSLFLAVRTPEVLRLLFGGGFDAAIPAARVVVWALTLYFSNSVLGHTLIAAQLQRIPAIAVACAVVANLSLNLVLIPRFGIVGAAWATVMSELLITAVQGVWVWRQLGGVNLRAMVGRPLLATAALGAVLLVGASWPLGAVALVGGGVYLGAAWSLQLVKSPSRPAPGAS